MSRHPEVLWAQRSSSSTPENNIIYFTINLPDIVESSLTYTLTSTSISFEAFTVNADSEQTKYEFDLELFAEVDPERSKSRLTSRSLFAILRKKEAKLEYWPRLTKEKLETPIKADFDRWLDEDEQDLPPSIEDEFTLVGGIGDCMDFSRMANLETVTGSMPVDSGTESDSDEDGPPPLEGVSCK